MKCNEMKVAFVSNNKKQTSKMLLFLLASFAYLDLGEYSVIKDYTTKTTKKTYKAHFTIYDRFIKKCDTENEAPISYKGYFLMKNYPDKFEVDRTKTEYKTITDFFQIKK